MNSSTLRIDYCSSAKRLNAVTGQPESFVHHSLSDPATGHRFIARASPGGRVECCNASDKPLNPRLDAAVIARIQAALDARWKVRS